MNSTFMPSATPQGSTGRGPNRGSNRHRTFAVATALATATAFSIVEVGIGAERQRAHAAGPQICSQSADGLYEFVGASNQSNVQTCTTTRAGVIKLIARGAGGGTPGSGYPGGVGAVVTTYQYLPQGSVLSLRVGHSDWAGAGGGSATSIRGNGLVVVAGGGGGGGNSGRGGHGAANNTAAGGQGQGGKGGQGGQANGRGGDGGQSNDHSQGRTNGQGGSGSSSGLVGKVGYGGGGGGAAGGNGGAATLNAFTWPGGVSSEFREPASSGGGGGATFGGGGAGPGAGGGGGGALVPGPNLTVLTSGGGAGGSHASATRAAYGFTTTYRPGGNQSPNNGPMGNGSVSISFVQANEKPRPQTVAGSCKSKIPVKKIKRHAKKKRTTTILPGNCKTVAGHRVKVSAKWYIGKKNVTKKRAGKWLKRKSYKNGRVNLITKSVPKKTKVVLTYTAPRITGTKPYNAYKVTKTIRIRK